MKANGSTVAADDGLSKLGVCVSVMGQSSSFGERLRWYRVMAAMTQGELAAFSTISVRAIRDLELGRASRPRRETVRLLADGLRLTGKQRVDFESSAVRSLNGALWTGAAAERGYEAPPALVSSIAGRTVELRTIEEALAGGQHRLINIVGVGGVGKTALMAHWVRSRYDEGAFPVWWRDLAEGADDGLAAVAGTARRTRPVDLPALADLVASNTMLVVFDGADESFPGDELAALLRRCPRLSVIVTSREPVITSEGVLMPLGPLATTGSDGGVSPALTVLVENIRRGDPTFEVDDANRGSLQVICDLLDGHPLALRQAATWCSFRSPDDLVERLSADIGALSAVSVERDGQADAMAAFSACVNALEQPEQILLGRLAMLSEELSPKGSAASAGTTPEELGTFLRKLIQRGIVRRNGARKDLAFALLNPIRILLRQRVGGRIRTAGLLGQLPLDCRPECRSPA
ncbi:helix-turn-helix domain-containing protein [Amycolatopsis sp. NPDC088138]|uniref:helix-turn-helix domain-containing protein n=1 Tax=Amycolatopsis sp. NPDC088138 TaxID=3363938 RepID=UPI0037F71044